MKATTNFNQPLPGLVDAFLDSPVVLYLKMFQYFPWPIFEPIRLAYERVLNQYTRRKSNPNETSDLETLWLDLAHVDPENLKATQSPAKRGVGGRPSTPFFALLKAFLGARVRKTEDTDISVFELLHNDPFFCQACGFSSPPSYRVVARFNQVMTEQRLWDQFFVLCAQHNLDTEAAMLPDTLALDTTHAEGDATLGKKVKGTDELTDNNIGLVRKSASVTYVGHKLAILSDPKQQLPWVIAAFPGQTADNHTLVPMLEQYAETYPNGVSIVRWLTVDGIYNTQANYAFVSSWGVGQTQLLTPIHPRNRKDLPVKASGITHINPYGVPVCIAEEELVFKGRDVHREHFVWVCPRLNPDYGAGTRCPKQYRCCPGAALGRVYRVPRELTPQINWDNPQFGQRHQNLYKQRTHVERVISWLKDRLGMRRVHRRGHAAAQSLGTQCAGLMHMFYYLRHIGAFPIPTAG